MASDGETTPKRLQNHHHHQHHADNGYASASVAALGLGTHTQGMHLSDSSNNHGLSGSNNSDCQGYKPNAPHIQGELDLDGTNKDKKGH